eukprot:g30174.t1
MHVSTAVDEKSDKSFTLQCLTVLKQFAVDAPQHMLARQDYVRMMWMMLQCEKPDDFVVATNKQYSVRDLVTLCFEMVGRPLIWRGQGLQEEGVDEKTGHVVVQVSEKYFRPTEVETLLGDPAKARAKLGWTGDRGPTGDRPTPETDPNSLMTI